MINQIAQLEKELLGRKVHWHIGDVTVTRIAEIIGPEGAISFQLIGGLPLLPGICVVCCSGQHQVIRFLAISTTHVVTFDVAEALAQVDHGLILVAFDRSAALLPNTHRPDRD